MRPEYGEERAKSFVCFLGLAELLGELRHPMLQLWASQGGAGEGLFAGTDLSGGRSDRSLLAKALNFSFELLDPRSALRCSRSAGRRCRSTRVASSLTARSLCGIALGPDRLQFLL